jgi:hypothetical protein
MKATMRFAGCAMVLVLVPALAGAQGKPAETKPAETKPAPKPAMQHDMSMMGKDTGMKHEMKPGMMNKDSSMMHEAMSSGWMEFDALHKALMETWHPAEKADFRPARARSAEVVQAAESWARSNGPARCDNAASREAIPGVVAAAKALAAVVTNRGSDDAVKAALKKTHDDFEKVAKTCLGASMGMKH